MSIAYYDNIYGEAAQKLKEVLSLFKENGLQEAERETEGLASRVLAMACDAQVPHIVEGRDLLWKEAPIVPDSCFAGGQRYLGWGAACKVAEADSEGWRLPTPSELKALYDEMPGCEVFSRHGRLKDRHVLGFGATAAVWTSQDDSRDFAIEGAVSDEFGLTFHPAFKTNKNSAWLVKAARKE